MRKPDFDNNILKVLKKQVPLNPTLFEFYLSDEALEALTGIKTDYSKPMDMMKRLIKAFYNAGYDFVPLVAGNFYFKRGDRAEKESVSINEGGIVTDWDSFEKYKWNNPEDCDYEMLNELAKELPDGMKFMIYSADGVLENVIALAGYENLCYLFADEPELVNLLFKNVGERLVKYHDICSDFKSVGIVFSNDDWGFKSGTMISHDDLKKYVYPYHKRIVEVAHRKNLPCAMHSCGNFDGIYKDLYDIIKFDGKHSNEDNILPVEKAYMQYAGKIAILGGIDVDFLCRASIGEIENRCKKMLKISEEKGGYALGSGNSIPKYMPLKNYLAMVKCVNPSLKTY